MRVPLALVLAGLTACGFVRVGSPVEGRDGLVSKRVLTKRAPETLLAEDMTACRVTPDVFAAAGAGTAVRCAWRRDVARR